MSKKQSELEVFGFTIPVVSGGRRMWPPRFKQFITEKMDSGDLTVQQVSKTCRVSKSLVYQWRMQARGKPVTASDWRAEAFAQVVVEDAPPDRAATAPSAGVISISGLTTRIELPADYPVADLVKIVQALAAQDTAR